MIGETVAKQREEYLAKEEYIKALKRRVKGETKENDKLRTIIKQIIEILNKALIECPERSESTRYGRIEWKE